MLVHITQFLSEFSNIKTSNGNIMRPMTSDELKLINKLLSETFPGADQLRQQIELAEVEELDDQGSLRFFSSQSGQADVLQRVPVEASTEDSDGILIHVLIHVVGGRLHELEFYKDSPGPIKSVPKLDSWKISRFY